MINGDVADILDELGDMEEIRGNRWEALAYRKAASSIRSLSTDLEILYKEGKLREIDGVGSAIEKKIIQYLKEGKIDKYAELKKQYPIEFNSLRRVQGLGPRKIYSLYTALGVRNLQDLRNAVDRGEIAGVPGFGVKSQRNIAAELEQLEKRGAERKPLGRVFDSIMELKDSLVASGLFSQVEVVGSTRRMRDTVGDVDILAVAERPDEGFNHFFSLDIIDSVLSRGPAKASARLKVGLNCDFRIFRRESFGSAMQYFTGSKQHNIKLRDIAIGLGLKLNEYGLFRGDLPVAGENEADIYSSLGLPWIPPEMRENTGEIEAGVAGNLPSPVRYEDVISDMHIEIDHKPDAIWVENLVTAMKENRLTYCALLISSKSASSNSGQQSMSNEMINSILDSISEIQSSYRLPILKGLAVDISNSGLDRISREIPKRLDYVAAFNGMLGSDPSANTELYLRAIESGYVDAIVNPTGRIINKRDPAPIQMDRLFEKCSANDVLLGINEYPERSDLPFDLVKRAYEHGVNFVLGSGSSDPGEIRFLKFSTAIARRGWVTKERVINTQTYDQVRRRLEKRRQKSDGSP